jgi:hypothetical protein
VRGSISGAVGKKRPDYPRNACPRGLYERAP